MKKVRFNPENEIFFFVATPNYSYSGPKKKKVQKRKSRVKQASKKKQVQLAENAKELKLSDTPVRLTRSSAHKMQEGNSEAVCLPCSVRKKVRSGEKNVGGCNKLPLEVTLSEGVGGETVSSGGLIHRQLRSRMVVCKYGGDSMVSRKKTSEDSVVASIGVEPEKIQEQFKVTVTKVEGSSVLSEKMGEIDSSGRITRSRTRAEGIAYCWIR